MILQKVTVGTEVEARRMRRTNENERKEHMCSTCKCIDMDMA